MSRKSDIEKIRSKIEQRMSYWWDKLPDADSNEETWTQAEVKALGAYMEAENLLDFIDNLVKKKQEKTKPDSKVGSIPLVKTCEEIAYDRQVRNKILYFGRLEGE